MKSRGKRNKKSIKKRSSPKIKTTPPPLQALDSEELSEDSTPPPPPSNLERTTVDVIIKVGSMKEAAAMKRAMQNKEFTEAMIANILSQREHITLTNPSSSIEELLEE